MKAPRKFFFLALCAIAFVFKAAACIWDAETLDSEKERNHDLASAILDATPRPTPDLADRIHELQANRREKDPMWWNNLAGAYLRSGQPQAAVDLLKGAVKKFPNDYGIHANLGTGYHLLGRYVEAEKEIGRDLEINPDAHFGLEKYHLALLQYLIKDAKYKSRHLYVDEFTVAMYDRRDGRFFYHETLEPYFKMMAQGIKSVAEAESYYAAEQDPDDKMEAMGVVTTLDRPPLYRSKWNLATDTNLEAGVIYMAQMNPKEPACFTMLGVVAWKNKTYNLAVAAFEKAIAVGSPQIKLLKTKIAEIKDYIKNSEKVHSSIMPPDSKWRLTDRGSLTEAILNSSP